MADKKKKRSLRMKILRSGDIHSQFRYPKHVDAKEVLERLGEPRTLLSSSSKVRACEGVGYLARVLYLSPGCYCWGASKGCLENCLGWTSGYMKEQRSRDARDRRTALYASSPERFIRMLKAELIDLRLDALEQGLLPACRLNGTADIPFEFLHPDIFENNIDIQFYDYTKLAYRCIESVHGMMSNEKPWPRNYHLTFSMHEKNAHEAQRVLDAGANVATVFWPSLPEMYLGRKVIDADRNDARWLDPYGVIAGLKAKGFVAREDMSGFVVHTDQPNNAFLTNHTNAG